MGKGAGVRSEMPAVVNSQLLLLLGGARLNSFGSVCGAMEPDRFCASSLHPALLR